MEKLCLGKEVKSRATSNPYVLFPLESLAWIMGEMVIPSCGKEKKKFILGFQDTMVRCPKTSFLCKSKEGSQQGDFKHV